MLPVRVVVVVFGTTEYLTVPSPVPVLPESMVIQAALLAAVQPHPLGSVTLTVSVPPASPKDWLVGAIENEQEIPA